MSKILKFIVNVFLAAAILIAAAILVPPVAGVTTTIVDSSSMDTNLALGSVAYSTGVDVTTLKAGDVILKETGSSTYAYTLTKCDAASGTFSGVSTANPSGNEETIALRNTVSKVAVTIPYIGYIMMAMHSLEGIVIIALVVVLMIILFVLSELWKPVDDEEEETEEEEEDLIANGLDPEDGAGIDTDTIKAAMQDNIAAVNRTDEEAAAPAAEETAAAPAEEAPAEAEAAAEAAGEETAAQESVAAPAEENAEAVSEATEISVEDETQPEAGELFGEEAEADVFDFERKEEPETFEEGEQEDIVSAVEKVMAGIMLDEGNPADAVPELEADTLPGADLGEQLNVPDEELGDGRFRRTKRPSLDEISNDAKKSGDAPRISRDDNSGVTIVDFTDSLLK
ncbi:MAG: hypothetical protein Q4B09_05140 [Lachnospiraceae bacterium]|nr:hypothetical protein [Lachnospiraceae bacterium]